MATNLNLNRRGAPGSWLPGLDVRHEIMKLLILIAAFVVLGFPQCRAESDSKPFEAVGRAFEEVIAKYLAGSGEPGPFSVIVDNSTQIHEPKHLPLPNDIQKRLKARLPKIWKDYIDVSELRFPLPNEKTPGGTKLRGIESKSGDRVNVFRIRDIKYISPDKLQIMWHYGSGPMSGVGGTYEVSKSKDEWTIESIDSYDN